ncbi:MAG: prepilin-type N-terminal cleavage/methylation domain-containing protein [Candidatus Eisenbacteria bacterium]
MGPSPRITRATTHRGFTLVEILVVLVIVGILITMAAVLTRGVSAAQKRSLTATRMAGIDAALVQFVMQSRRLPCPGDGSIGTGMPNAGVESRALGVCTLVNQSNGVVPWITLGLPEAEATDAWDRRLTFRAHITLVDDNVMDMSACDPAGGGAAGAGGICSSPCATPGTTCTSPTNYLTPKGFTIRSVVGGVLMAPPTTGAAYVVISHGETGGGAFLNSGLLSTSTTTDGLEEQKNYANLALQPYYLDDSVSDVAGANHFDDVVSRPSVLSVISKAALGPRSH